VDWFRLTQVREEVAGLCEHANEPSGHVKSRWVFDQLGS
jgi:hypothetical protein